MAEELQFPSRPDNKRKFDDPSPPPRRPTGFSAPITSASPDGPAAAAPASYNSVPPPVDGIELAKQRAQEIVARLFNDAESKRPRVENSGNGDDAGDKDYNPPASDYYQKSQGQQLSSQGGTASSATFSSYGGYQNSSRRIDIPNGRVGVIIGKGGETIKYLQVQSGARIQVTRDSEVVPNSQTRAVELTGTSDQVSRAEQLIKDVLAEAEAGGSGIGVARKSYGGGEQFSMKVPNDKVGLIIGKGGENIKNMQAQSGARIQLIPLHLPPGDTSTERMVQIDGTTEQIESAKQLVNEVINSVHRQAHRFLFPLRGTEKFATATFKLFDNHIGKVLAQWCHLCKTCLVLRESHVSIFWSFVQIFSPILVLYMHYVLLGTNRGRNNQMSGSYSQQGYRPPRPPTSWAPPGQNPMQQPGYYMQQPGAYPGAPPQFNASQPPYGGYPPAPASGGYPSGWDQSSNPPPAQQTPAGAGAGYDYYNQQQPQQQQSAAGSAPTDNSGYNYGQPAGYGSQGGYGDATYSQPTTNQQQNYGQENYSQTGYYAQVSQPGYPQPASNPQVGYDQQGYGAASTYGAAANATQDGSSASYGSTQVPPSQEAPPVQTYPNQQGYAGQAPSYPSQGTAAYGAQAGYPSQSVPPPQGQKSPANQATYGQAQPPAASQSGYVQPAPVQPGYELAPAQTGYSGYATAGPQSGYGQPQSYGAAPPSQSGYGQPQQ